MRLIDDTTTKIDVWGLFNDTYNDASRFTEEETEFAKRILSDVQEVIESQPTAFDLESVMQQIKDKGAKLCCSVKCNDDCENCEHGVLMKSIIEILKSAANATNGKNGG